MTSTRPDHACPPASAQAVADVDPVVVRHIVDELRSRGIDPDAACEGSGLGVADLSDADFLVSYAQASRVIRRAIRLLRDRHVGLRLGAAFNPVSWGTCLLGLMASGDLREMLAFAVDHCPATGRLLRLRSESDATGVYVLAEPWFDEPEVECFLVEYTFAAFTRACRTVIGPGCAPLAVHLAMPRPKEAHAFAAALGCEPRFAQADHRMRFSARPVAVPTADAITAARARRLLDAQASPRTFAKGIEGVVLQAIHRRLDAAPTLREIATSIHTSERTLRRRLADEGVSYAGLLARERARRAVALIRAKQHSLDEVAAAIGFVDVRSLRRAIKRWTGKSPTSIQRGD